MRKKLCSINFNAFYFFIPSSLIMLILTIIFMSNQFIKFQINSTYKISIEYYNNIIKSVDINIFGVGTKEAMFEIHTKEKLIKTIIFTFLSRCEKDYLLNFKKRKQTQKKLLSVINTYLDNKLIKVYIKVENYYIDFI